MKDNIALIGFMGSGKTTVGRILAKYLDMKFIDIDKAIAMCEKKSIPEIFEEKGESYFRKMENQIIEEECRNNNIVIATGGGVIIDNENIKNLKKTSYVVYLDCDIDSIYERVKNSKHRPLLNNTENMYEKIKELYEKRKLLYKISCDYSISINKKTNVYDTVEAIKDAYILS
ncbi:MAG: shikimate kinase [Cetobacterium sp.]|uniref:shikimate kinase n=1 Tax=unclassified Cetobacterium TaxID=2630983 RepID=UPI00163C11D5|nr:shikimate kinase [Cetobacterium sp. 2A]MBC2856648.1 shikimate kinase [Cetobacterium sp. 2A]